MAKKKDVKKKTSVAKKNVAKKSVVEKPKKRIETTDQEEFAKLLGEGFKTVEIRAEIKGSDIAPGVPKTYVVEK